MKENCMYRIYIVEDDKGISDGIMKCLEGWGWMLRELRISDR